MLSRTCPEAGNIAGLLVGRSGRSGHRHGSTLRRAYVARGFVLVEAPYDHLVEQVIAAGIELDRLVDVTISLLDGLVVGGHVERELSPLGIDLFQLKADGR